MTKYTHTHTHTTYYQVIYVHSSFVISYSFAAGLTLGVQPLNLEFCPVSVMAVGDIVPPSYSKSLRVCIHGYILST